MSHNTTGMTDTERGAMMVKYHKQLRDGRLDEEYKNFHHYSATFTSPDGKKTISLSLDELFQMFELQRGKL